MNGLISTRLRLILLVTLCIGIVSVISAMAEDHPATGHDTSAIPHDTARLLDTSLSHGSVTNDSTIQVGEHVDATNDAHSAASTAHADGGHGEEAGGHDDHGGTPHLPSLAAVLVSFLGPDFQWMVDWINPIYAALTSLLFIWVAFTVYHKRKMIPGPFQNAIEMLVEGMYNFLYGILGDETRRYLPFIGTIFFYILVNNLWGIIPLGHSPSTSINVTASLALCVFAYSQYTGISRLGIVGYLDHLAGSPRDPIMWALVPLQLPMHIIGEIAKPFSLALRLFGNITGEDILVAAFVGLGVTALAVFGSPIGLPLNVPFILLGLLLSTIQALVFTLLSTIYILMMLPHHSDDHH